MSLRTKHTGSLVARHFGAAAVGSAVLSASVTALFIVGLVSAQSALPKLSLGASKGAASAMVIYGTFDISASKQLRVDGGDASSFQLVSSHDPKDLAQQLASTFSVPSTDAVVTSNGSGEVVQVGASDGANVQVTSSGGYVTWSYQSSGSSIAVSGPGDPVSVTPGDASVTTPGSETSAKALRDATDLWASLGVHDYVTPSVDSSSGNFYVSAAVSVNGIGTDLSYNVDYNSNGVVLDASGVDVGLGESRAYPLVSANDAISSEAAKWSSGYSGGEVAPQNAGVIDPGSVPTGDNNATSGGDTPSTVSGPPVYTVVIDHAQLVYQSYQLSDGSTWLLPAWQLSGTSTSDQPGSSQSDYTNTLLAVSPQYVDLAPRMIMY